MVELSNIVGAFGAPIRTTSGRIVRGNILSPSKVRATYDGRFSPRSMLIVTPTTPVTAGDTVFDQYNNQYLLGDWNRDDYRTTKVSRTFVMFLVSHILVWTRPGSTTEPISGLGIPGPPTSLGSVPVLLEPIRRAQDALHVVEQYDRVLTNAAIQVGDFLGEQRVRRLEWTLGLTYAEVL